MSPLANCVIGGRWRLFATPGHGEGLIQDGQENIIHVHLMNTTLPLCIMLYNHCITRPILDCLFPVLVLSGIMIRLSYVLSRKLCSNGSGQIITGIVYIAYNKRIPSQRAWSGRFKVVGCRWGRRVHASRLFIQFSWTSQSDIRGGTCGSTCP